MKSRFLLCLLLASAQALAGSIVPQRASTDETLDRLFDETMAHYDLPGLALGVMEDGRLVYRRTGGTRLVGSDEPIDSETLFKIASNSKAMTAALLARLVDAGKLRWEDPVVRHLPQFRMRDPWVTAQIQVRDLLIHNSGLGLGAGDLMLWPEPNDFGRGDIIAGLAHLRPATSFRATYAYDNLLYIVAGEVAAAAGGADYETLLRREVFQPLGLSCRVGAFSRDTVGNLAQPHRRENGQNVAAGVDGQDIPALASAAAGGVRCSLDDMLAWMGQWLDPRQAPDWLSAPQRATMWTPQMPMPLSARQKRWENSHVLAYGYGFRLSDANGQWRVGHTGTLDGMYSAMAMFPDRRSGYVFLINGEAGQARIALEAALTRVLTRPGANVRIADFAADLARERAASGAQEARQAAADREAVGADDLAGRLGIWEDAWFGEIALCPAGDGVNWRSLRSPRLHGTVMQANGRFLVRWNDPGVAGADAWLDFPAARDGTPGMAMAAIDPETDFSYDFHDLSPRWTRDCD